MQSVLRQLLTEVLCPSFVPSFAHTLIDLSPSHGTYHHPSNCCRSCHRQYSFLHLCSFVSSTICSALFETVPSYGRWHLAQSPLQKALSITMHLPPTRPPLCYSDSFAMSATTPAPSSPFTHTPPSHRYCNHNISRNL